jgi:hypothetical protein
MEVVSLIAGVEEVRVFIVDDRCWFAAIASRMPTRFSGGKPRKIAETHNAVTAWG